MFSVRVDRAGLINSVTSCTPSRGCDRSDVQVMRGRGVPVTEHERERVEEFTPRMIATMDGVMEGVSKSSQ